MQLRRLAALERQPLTDEYEDLMAKIADYEAILASPERQREIISEELGEIVAKYGDDRRTQIIPLDGDVTNEDLIAEEDVVVTITRGGYAKRTKTDLYRAQRRGGKGVRGAQLRTDDIVDHFFVTTTHRWILFFTNKGRVYRAKAYELPDAPGMPAASTWRTCWRSSPTSGSPRCWRSRTTRSRRTWCWPPRAGWSRSPG